MPGQVIRAVQGRRAYILAALLMQGNAGVSAGEPATYRAGIVELLPTIDFETGVDSNLLNTSSDAEKLNPAYSTVDTGYWETDAAIQAWIQDRKNSYSLYYQLTDGRYFDSDQDNYTDQKLKADIHLEANSKNLFDLYFEYFSTHEARGTGFSEGLIAFQQDKPFLYDDTLLGGQYTLGNRKSSGRLELAATWFKRQWDSEELPWLIGGESVPVNVTEGRNHEKNLLRGTFFWGIAPRTDLLFEAKYQTITYDSLPFESAPPDDASDSLFNLFESLDSTEAFGLVGIEWELTGKTTGLAKIGYSSKDFKSDARGSFSMPTWDVGVTWEPRSFSTLQLFMRSYPEETWDVGSFIELTEIQFSWNHSWLKQFSTRVDFLHQNLAFKDSFDDRDDERAYLTLAADYDFFRWLTLGAGYRFQQRESSRDTLDFDRNQLFLSLSLSL